MNDSKSLVSICCLSYNQEKYIKEAIEALWMQEYKNIEILALDDGSSDNSPNILSELAKKSPVPMQIILQKNSGNIAKNLNILLKKAKGKYVTITSLDDVYLTDTISKKVKLMDDDQNLIFISNSVVQIIDGKSEKKDIQKLSLYEKETITAQDLYDKEYHLQWPYYVQGGLYRLDAIKEVGLYDEDLLADDLQLRVKLAIFLMNNPNKKFRLIPEISFLYRRHSSNISCNSLRQLSLIKEVLNRFYPERDYPIEWKKRIENNIEILSFSKFTKFYFKGSFNFKYAILLYGKIKIKNLLNKLKKMRREYFQIKMKKNIKIIKLFGVSFIDIKRG